MSSNGKNRPIFGCVVLVLAMTASSVLAGSYSAFLSSDNLMVKETGGSSPHLDFHYITHLATSLDVESLKAKLGVRDLSKNYNILMNGHGTGLAPPTEEEWEEMIGHASVVDGISGPLMASVVDHSQEPYFPPVRSQDGQGSCAAWAVSYYTNGYTQAKDMNWTDASSGNNDHLMSPAWVYNKVNWGGDHGSSLQGNIILIQTVGNAVWSTMPYDPSDPTSWGNEAAWRSAPQFRAGDYQWTSASNTNVIKGWLEEGYVLPIALDAGQYSNGLGSGDDTITSAEYNPGYPNHANTIVGYNDSKGQDGETGAFKIVNSWGSGWGSAWGGNGYYWMTYKALAELVTPVFRYRDKTHYNPSLLGVWRLNPQGGRNAPVTLGIGPHSDPAATRMPRWNGGDLDFPSFMALDYTDFKNEWRLGNSLFFLDIGSGKDYSTITSFKMELYETDYSPGSYTRISRESPDVPQSTPGYVTVSLTPNMRITNPLDGDSVHGVVNVSGKAIGPAWTAVVREDFESSWPGNWTVGDDNALAGNDYWGLSDYRSYNGSRSSWSAEVGGSIEVAYAEDFDHAGSFPSGWSTTSEGPDSHPWEIRLDAGSDYRAECNSSDAGPGTNITERLYMTTGFQASTFSSLTLQFYLDYLYGDGDEYARVLYANATSYPVFLELATWTSSVKGTQTLNISFLAGDPDVHIAFVYHGTGDWHARVDDVLVLGEVLNEVSRHYDNNMDAYMLRSVDLSGYNSATLMYKYWLRAQSGLDFLNISYFDMTWHLIDSHTGSTDGWQISTASIPTTSSAIRFYFHADESVHDYEGAYLDDILLLGSDAIDSVYVKIDNGSWNLVNGTTQWWFEWNTTTLQEGEHTVYARAYFSSNFSEDSVVVTVDTSPPTNPDSYSSSHTPTVWSKDNTVYIAWYGAWDNISGVYGYAVEWTTSSSTVPAETVNTTSSFTTSSPLSDGDLWYVHIRTVDKAGNWAVGAFHVGPFYVDATPPENPNSYSSSHSVGVWSSDDTIFISWSGASDLSSGVYGYAFRWSTFPSSVPSPVMTTNKTNITSPPLSTSKSWYFHVRARDVAGNWAVGAFHVGPFYIDTNLPSTTCSFFGQDGDFGWYLSNVSASLNATDSHSGVNLTMYRIDGGMWVGYSSPFDVVNDGNHSIDYYSIDVVGNQESVKRTNVSIDATPPINPNNYSSSHGVGLWSGDNTIDISWSGARDETSGVFGYSFVWTSSASTIPDETVNSTNSSTTSPNLSTGGNWYFHVRTRDVAGNWAADAYHVGPFRIDRTPPSTPAEVWASLEGSGWKDVNISWNASVDPQSGIQRYDIYYASAYNGSGVGYVLLGSVPASRNYFVHHNAGESGPSNYFYVVDAVDLANNTASYPVQAGKFVRHLQDGWQLISVPLIQRDSSLLAVLRTLSFDTVRSYSSHKWKSYFRQKGYGDLGEIDTSIGMWVHVTHESNLTLAGTVSARTEISLAKGWNLVGYPSFSGAYTVGDLKADTNALRVEVCDASSPPYFLRVANDSELLAAGMGYWIRVPQQKTWTVLNEGDGMHLPRAPIDDGVRSLPPDFGGLPFSKPGQQEEPHAGLEGTSQAMDETHRQSTSGLPVPLILSIMFIGLVISIRYDILKRRRAED